MRTCTKCKTPKELSAFRTEKRTKVGLHSTCKECEQIWRKQHRAKPEIMKTRAEQRRQYKIKQFEINQNPEAVDKRKYCPRCNETKPASGFNRVPRIHGGLSSECKTCNNDRVSKVVRELKEQVFDLLGHECRRCGFDDKRALQIDHVNGGGNKEHLKITNRAQFLRKVITEAATAKYQMLCANCNWIKRAERDENPIGPRLVAAIA